MWSTKFYLSFTRTLRCVSVVTGLSLTMLAGQEALAQGLSKKAPLFNAKAQPANLSALKAEVEKIEYEFANTLAQRDFKAFSHYIADDAVFITGPKVLEGKAAILDSWEHFFEDPQAPFSWKPDEILILLSGKLASSSGPVFDAKGVQIARYISIWRKDGKQWKIVMDRGVDIRRCKKD
ncbi:nuclear transport factor 2 family protein [Undibacterium cyanobacteriorum]|uniref:Nuclear transport factor 2 family protein n=1 Tax=Undibacterium cyanobacteriorum TaxID=3073561 RepID=A0ABY9RF29_9BURK|nr:nuclear transport factor 2 family protein [Undibacterium sp. 20NA77.5]WMW79836.1 nuclear transport factor 2 family protein [Undibacterium sp. 20NA77.5]